MSTPTRFVTLRDVVNDAVLPALGEDGETAYDVEAIAAQTHTYDVEARAFVQSVDTATFWQVVARNEIPEAVRDAVQAQRRLDSITEAQESARKVRDYAVARADAQRVSAYALAKHLGISQPAIRKIVERTPVHLTLDEARAAVRALEAAHEDAQRAALGAEQSGQDPDGVSDAWEAAQDTLDAYYGAFPHWYYPGAPASRVWIATDDEVTTATVLIGDVVDADDLTDWLLEHGTDSSLPAGESIDPAVAAEIARKIIAGEETSIGSQLGQMTLNVTVLWRDVDGRKNA